MDRRQFTGLCAGSAVAAGLAAGHLAFAAAIEDFAPAKLVHRDGSPLKVTDVGTQEAMVFAYPYQGVPCFLINLGAHRPKVDHFVSSDDGAYTNPPGVGPEGSLVAFVAVCQHALSYPAPDASVIRYAPSGSRQAGGAADRIVCCAHGSVYDPADGARPVVGPAPNPLLPVRLAYDAATSQLSATGTIGTKFIERFFDAYKSDLIQRFGPGGYRRDVGATTVTEPLSKYSATISDC